MIQTWLAFSVRHFVNHWMFEGECLNLWIFESWNVWMFECWWLSNLSVYFELFSICMQFRCVGFAARIPVEEGSHLSKTPWLTLCRITSWLWPSSKWIAIWSSIADCGPLNYSGLRPAADIKCSTSIYDRGCQLNPDLTFTNNSRFSKNIDFYLNHVWNKPPQPKWPQWPK